MMDRLCPTPSSSVGVAGLSKRVHERICGRGVQLARRGDSREMQWAALRRLCGRNSGYRAPYGCFQDAVPRVRSPSRSRQVERPVTKTFHIGEFLVGQLLAWVVESLGKGHPVPAVGWEACGVPAWATEAVLRASVLAVLQGTLAGSRMGPARMSSRVFSVSRCRGRGGSA